MHNNSCEVRRTFSKKEKQNSEAGPTFWASLPLLKRKTVKRHSVKSVVSSRLLGHCLEKAKQCKRSLINTAPQLLFAEACRPTINASATINNNSWGQ
jgi:hypothetical protein